ncbi:MAG: hypothetical protein AB8G99_24920 [Planctomycetaceae bacterium]
MPGTDKVPEPPTNTNSFAIANGALIAALHKQFADLRQRVAKAKDDAERSRLEKELVTVTKLASMQIMQLEALLFEPRLRVERFRQAEEQLEKAGVKDAAVLNGFKNEWKRVADSIKQIETRIDEAKAPFFERKIASLPSGDLTLSQFVELVSRQTGITFRLGTAINGEQLVPLRDSHSLDDFLGGLDGQPRVLDNSDLQSVLEMFLSKIQLKHRNEINPETGELICVIVYDKFKFDGVQLDEALQIFVESLGVGYDVEPGVSLDVKVTTDDEGVGRRHLRPLLNTVGLDYRIEASKRLPGGERFRIYPLPSLAPKQEKEDVPEPKPDPLSTGFRG